MFVALLSVSLLAGVFVNLQGAWAFLRAPERMAIQLGLAGESSEGAEQEATSVFGRLVGVCLIALAIFYFVTALGPIQQPWNVVAAAAARICGVVYYCVALWTGTGPKSFRKYLFVNLLLALSHITFLVLAPGGVESLSESLATFHWLSSGS